MGHSVCKICVSVTVSYYTDFIDNIALIINIVKQYLSSRDLRFVPVVYSLQDDRPTYCPILTALKSSLLGSRSESSQAKDLDCLKNTIYWYNWPQNICKFQKDHNYMSWNIQYIRVHMRQDDCGLAKGLSKCIFR